MRKDIETNPNITKLALNGDIKAYLCRAKGVWLVTASKEYNDRFGCWMERIAMSHWNRKTKKVPTWEEILAVKREFFGPEEECIHFIPADSEYVNIKEDCMHIFHPLFDRKEK